MKKLIAAGVVLAWGMSSAAHADQVIGLETFAGGHWVFMTSGANAGMGDGDLTSNKIFSHNFGAQVNGLHNCVLYSANNTGWGYGTYGGNNIAEFYCPNN